MDTVYENSQWKVYIDGDLDCLDGSYWIRKDRLLEARWGNYEWPEHLGGKCWIDMDAFVQAWLFAIKFNKMAPDEDKLADAIREGYNKVMLSVASKRDRYLFKHHNGELLKHTKLPDDPVEALKLMTVDLEYERRLDDWRKGVDISGRIKETEDTQ